MHPNDRLIEFLGLSVFLIGSALVIVLLARRFATKRIEKLSKNTGLPITEDLRTWLLPLLTRRYRLQIIGMAGGSIIAWTSGIAVLAATFHGESAENFYSMLVWIGLLVGYLAGSLLAARASVSGITSDGIRVANPRPRELSDYVTRSVVRGIHASYMGCAGTLVLGLALVLVHRPALGLAQAATALVIAGLMWISLRALKSLLMRPLPAGGPEDILRQDALLVELLTPVAQWTRGLGWMAGLLGVLTVFVPHVPQWLGVAALLVAGFYAVMLIWIADHSPEAHVPPVLRRPTSQAA